MSSAFRRPRALAGRLRRGTRDLPTAASTSATVRSRRVPAVTADTRRAAEAARTAEASCARDRASSILTWASLRPSSGWVYIRSPLAASKVAVYQTTLVKAIRQATFLEAKILGHEQGEALALPSSRLGHMVDDGRPGHGPRALGRDPLAANRPRGRRDRGTSRKDPPPLPGRVSGQPRRRRAHQGGVEGAHGSARQRSVARLALPGSRRLDGGDDQPSRQARASWSDPTRSRSTRSPRRAARAHGDWGRPTRGIHRSRCRTRARTRG